MFRAKKKLRKQLPCQRHLMGPYGFYMDPLWDYGRVLYGFYVDILAGMNSQSLNAWEVFCVKAMYMILCSNESAIGIFYLHNYVIEDCKHQRYLVFHLQDIIYLGRSRMHWLMCSSSEVGSTSYPWLPLCSAFCEVLKRCTCTHTFTISILVIG